MFSCSYPAHPISTSGYVWCKSSTYIQNKLALILSRVEFATTAVVVDGGVVVCVVSKQEFKASSIGKKYLKVTFNCSVSAPSEVTAAMSHSAATVTLTKFA